MSCCVSGVFQMTEVGLKSTVVNYVRIQNHSQAARGGGVSSESVLSGDRGVLAEFSRLTGFERGWRALACREGPGCGCGVV